MYNLIKLINSNKHLILSQFPISPHTKILSLPGLARLHRDFFAESSKNSYARRMVFIVLNLLNFLLSNTQKRN